MNVKIDTKEKFSVITPNERDIPANMTDELINLLLGQLKKDNPHVILNMLHVKQVAGETIDRLVETQEKFSEENSSFVVCNLDQQVHELLNKSGLLEIMNITPTESEAWDIVQMEEIERELMKDFDNEN